MDEVCTRFKNIRDEYANNHLNIHSMIKTVCYLEVNDYMRATENGKKQILLALHAADVVHLISAENVNPMNLMKIKHAFALNGLQVFDKSLQYSSDDSQHSIKKMMDACTEQLEKEHKINYLAYYLRLPKDMEKRPKPDKLPAKVLEFAIDKKSREEIPDYYQHLMEKKVEKIRIYSSHRKGIINLLKEKNEYYSIANPDDKRMPIIQVSIEKIKKNPELTYKQLLNELRLLEEKLIENRPSKFYRFFEKNYGLFRSNPSKAVHEEIKKIEKDLELRKKNK